MGKKLRALMLMGLLGLAAPSAFAIPFSVDIVGGAGNWNLSGPTSTGDDWAVAYSGDFDILPGLYSWTINGGGLGFAAWSLSLNNQVVYTDHAAGFIFRISDSYGFEAVSVPEPATLSLFGMGLLALGFAIRRNRPQA